MNKKSYIFYTYSRVFLSMIIILLSFSCAMGQGSTSGSRPTREARKENKYLSRLRPAPDTSLKYNDSLFFSGVYYNNTGEYNKALTRLNRFSRLHPDIPATYFQIARAHIGKESSVDTIYKYINKAYEMDPDNKWYMQYYAALMTMRGNFSEAAGIYNDLIDKGNYDKDIFYKAFVNYQKAEEYDSLFSLIEKIDQFTDFDDEYIDQLTISVHQLKKDNEIVEAYHLEKINESEEPLPAQLELLKFYSETEQADKKEKLLEELDYFSLNEDNREALLSTLILSYDTQAVSGILRHAFVEQDDSTKLIELSSTLFTAWAYSPRAVQPYIRGMRSWVEEPDMNYNVAAFLMAYYMAAEHYDSALYYSKKYFELGSMSISNYSILMVASMETDSTDYIRRIADIALRRDSTFAIAHYSQGLLLLYDDQPAEAYEKFLLTAKYIDTQNYNTQFISELYALLGDNYQRIEQYDKDRVAGYYDTSLHYNGANPTTLNNYAYYLSIIGERLEDAEAMSSASLKAQPRNPYFLDTYAWIQYKLGNFDVAKEYLLKAIENSPEPSATLWEHLGDVELKLNNKEKAIDYYKIAIDSKGDVEMLRKKISDNEK